MIEKSKECTDRDRPRVQGSKENISFNGILKETKLFDCGKTECQNSWRTRRNCSQNKNSFRGMKTPTWTQPWNKDLMLLQFLNKWKNGKLWKMVMGSHARGPVFFFFILNWVRYRSIAISLPANVPCARSSVFISKLVLKGSPILKLQKI